MFVPAAVLKRLGEVWVSSADDLAKATKRPSAEVYTALQVACQNGQVAYDLARAVYRLRPLSDAPIDLGRLQYRNVRERVAHDLVARWASDATSPPRACTAGCPTPAGSPTRRPRR